MLSVNYQTSPIVNNEFSTDAELVPSHRVLDEGVLVARDRGPDVPELSAAETETRLFDLFSTTYHTVFVFTPDIALATDIVEALNKYPADVIRPVILLPQGSEATTFVQADVVVDRGGHAYRAYLVGKDEQRVVVVRPDGVVGAIVHGVEGVGAYFSVIFIS